MAGMLVHKYKLGRYANTKSSPALSDDEEDVYETVFGPQKIERARNAGSYLLESTHRRQLKYYTVYSSPRPFFHGTMCELVWRAEGPLYQHEELGPVYAEACVRAPPGLSKAQRMNFIVETMTNGNYMEAFSCSNYDGTVDHYVRYSSDHPKNLYSQFKLKDVTDPIYWWTTRGPVYEQEYLHL